MGKTYVTHAWMPYREDHIAWSVMKTFCKLWKKATKDEVYLVDPLHDDGDLSNTKGSTVIVFATQKMTSRVKRAAYRADRLLCVFEDPNWPVECCPNRAYEMITWFKTLDGFDNVQSYKTLKMFTEGKFDVAMPKAHCYLPLTSTLLEDHDHFSRYNDVEFNQAIDSQSGIVYAGSLKKDRASEFAQLAMTGCDFYGNFSIDDLCRVAGIKKSNLSPDTRCMGHVSPFEVPQLYKQYEQVAYIPDESTILLDTDTLRLAELAMADCKVLPITSNPRLESKLLDRLSMVCDEDGNASWRRFKRNSDAVGFVDRLKRYNAQMGY